MTVIAKKTEGIVLMYSLLLLAGLMLIGIGIDYAEDARILMIIFGIAISAVAVYTIVKYLRMPHDIITLDSAGILHLPNDITLNPADLTDVSYKRAQGKGFQYKWGDIILSTHLDRYKFNFVDDCQNTAKELTRLMYESKNNK
jgi:hypothetical protein